MQCGQKSAYNRNSLTPQEANGKMQAWRPARVSRFRVRDKVRVSIRNRVGVRVSDGVRVSTFYF